MSVFVKIFDCPLDVVKIPDVLRAVMRVDEDGSVYINVKFNEKEQCDDYELAWDCNATLPLEEMIKTLIVEDDCGKPALNILANICDVCGFISREDL